MSYFTHFFFSLALSSSSNHSLPPSHLSHFCQPLIFCIPLLSSPFSNQVLISACAFPSSVSFLPLFSAYLKLVKMTSECSWSDALVELQVWCQLATFCYEAEEHSLLLQSMEKALMLEEAAATSLIKKPFVL